MKIKKLKNAKMKKYINSSELISSDLMLWIWIYTIIFKIHTVMDRKSVDDYSVPSLSLASSRARRAVPTKDYQNNHQISGSRITNK